MNEKFVRLLEELDGKIEEGRKPISDEEKEKRQIAKDEAPKKKRGRPAKSEDDEDGDDNSGKEGIRTITLTAKINDDGEKSEETKVIKDVKVDDIDSEIAKWEKALHKKFDYNATITIKKKIGDYDSNPELDTNRPAIDLSGEDGAE